MTTTTSKAKAELTRSIVVLFAASNRQAFVTTNFAYMGKTPEQLVEFAKKDLANKAKCVQLLAAEDLQAVILTQGQQTDAGKLKATVCAKLKELGVTLTNTVPRTVEQADISALDFGFAAQVEQTESEAQPA